jgi:hypothetical protein
VYELERPGAPTRAWTILPGEEKVNDQPITGTTYVEVIAKLGADGRIPALAEVFDDGLIHHEMDYVVDLKTALREAIIMKAEVLQVYADVVRIPGGFKLKLGEEGLLGEKGVYRLDIIARRLEIEGNKPAELNLKDDPDRGSATSARLLVGEMTGELLVRSKSDGVAAEPKRFQPNLDLRPWTYQLKKGETIDAPAVLVSAKTKLAINMLSGEKPLYRLLKASFELAAGLTAEARLDPAKLALSRSILQWLTRWSYYPSAGLTPLFQTASSLLQVLPTVVQGPGSALVHVVPRYPSKVYFEMARSQWESAKDYDLEAHFNKMGDQIGKVTQQIVSIWVQRDLVDVEELGTRIEDARDRVKRALSALKTAGKEMEDQAFENKFFARELEFEQEVARIKGAVKLAFDIVSAVVQIGVGVATGLTNPQGMNATTDALGHLDPGRMYETIKAIKDNNPNVSIIKKGYLVIGELLYSYVDAAQSFIKSFRDMDMLPRNTFIASLQNVGSGVMALFNSVDRLMNLTRNINVANPVLNINVTEADEIGALVSMVAKVIDPPKTKAAWDVFLAEATAQFQAITDDQETPPLVRKAARNYRVGIEKLAIYGRMLSERQAIFAQEVRELGSLILTKASVQQKKGQLDLLGKNLADETAVRRALDAENDNRLRELGRTFFTTIWGFRSAVFYEAMRWEIPSFTVPKTGKEMGELYLAMQRVMREVGSAEKRERDNIERPLKFHKREGFLDDLKASGSAKLHIDLTNEDFDRFDWFGVQNLKVWLDDVLPNKKTGVRLTMTSESSVMNRLKGSDFSFSGQPVDINFEYDKHNKPTLEHGSFDVQPTPFSTWTLRIHNKQDLDLHQLSAVRLVVTGRARKRK